MTRLRRSADALRWSLLAGLGLLPLGGCESPPGPVSDCSSPQDLLPGADTGFVRCSEGYVVREAVHECPSRVPRDGEAEAGDGGGAGGASGGNCRVDADCSAEFGIHGFCAPDPDPWSNRDPICQAGCVSDSECSSDQLCECGDPIGICVPAQCRSPADCPGHARCLATVHDGVDYLMCQSIFRTYACDSKQDECTIDEGCPGDCVVSEEGRRCRDSSVYEGCGRPFLVEEFARTAPLVERSDWLASLGAVDLTDSDAEERAGLAAHWARSGLLEHASITAFVRFELQLVSVGAPEELLELTRQAQADETEHARLCFALASQYAGRALGPGQLSLVGAFDDLSLEGILRTTLLEGCIGETRAALEAERALDACQDPVVCGVLRTIARDEARHAELAWRFTHWLLEEYPDLRRTFDDTLADARPPAPLAAESPVPPLGSSALAQVRLDEAARAEVQRMAWRYVIEPSARALRV